MKEIKIDKGLIKVNRNLSFGCSFAFASIGLGIATGMFPQHNSEIGNIIPGLLMAGPTIISASWGVKNHKTLKKHK